MPKRRRQGKNITKKLSTESFKLIGKQLKTKQLKAT